MGNASCEEDEDEDDRDCAAYMEGIPEYIIEEDTDLEFNLSSYIEGGEGLNSLDREEGVYLEPENTYGVPEYRSYQRRRADRINAWRKRKDLERQRTPKWTTKEDIEEMKAIRKRVKKLSVQVPGVEWLDWQRACDHIIPLNGKNVSGLHHPCNMQILTSRQNLKKSNKFDGMNIPCLGLSIPINRKKVKVMQC